MVKVLRCLKEKHSGLRHQQPQDENRFHSVLSSSVQRNITRYAMDKRFAVATLISQSSNFHEKHEFLLTNPAKEKERAKQRERTRSSLTARTTTFEESASRKKGEERKKNKPTSTLWKCFMSASNPIKTPHYELKLPSRPPRLFSLCPAWHRAQTGLPQTDSGTAFQAPIHTGGPGSAAERSSWHFAAHMPSFSSHS